MSCRLYARILHILGPFHRIGKNTWIHPSCDIRRAARRHISLGDKVGLFHDVWLNIPYEAVAEDQKNPILSIGSGTVIGRRSTISALHHIEVGEKVLFGPNVFVTDHSHEFRDTLVSIAEQGVTEGGTVIIEDGCWLGHNAVVLTHRGKTVRIGRNSIVGANTVVTKSFPACSILVGNPARNVGLLSRSDARAAAPAQT